MLVRYPVLVRLVVWGHTQQEAHRAADDAWLLADQMDWTVVAVTTVFGGRASERLAEAAKTACGPLRNQHHTYDRVYQFYDAPLNDPGNLAAFARWTATW